MRGKRSAIGKLRTIKIRRTWDPNTIGQSLLRNRAKLTVEPRFNEHLYYEFLAKTNHIPSHSNSKIYEKEPRFNETSFSEHFVSTLALRYIEFPLHCNSPDEK